MKVLTCLMLVLALAGCTRERRKPTDVAPSSARPEGSPESALQPGPTGTPPSAEPSAVALPAEGMPHAPYEQSAWAVSEGKRLYQWYNCVGCHANGGGGMGPPLMDDKWIYGSDPIKVHQSIVDGRPNGMPAFGGKIPDSQIWQLVAYVRSMSGLLPKDVRQTRSDHMSVRPSEQAMRPAKPKNEAGTPPSAERPG